MQNNKKHCLVCNEEIKTNPVEVHGKYSIYQCQNCKLQFADLLDYSPKAYNEAFKGADTALNKNNSEFYRRGLTVLFMATGINSLALAPYQQDQQVVIKWLKGNIPQGTYVFDLGQLIAKSWRGRGIDNRAREGIVSPDLADGGFCI